MELGTNKPKKGLAKTRCMQGKLGQDSRGGTENAKHAACSLKKGTSCWGSRRVATDDEGQSLLREGSCLPLEAGNTRRKKTRKLQSLTRTICVRKV